MDINNVATINSTYTSAAPAAAQSAPAAQPENTPPAPTSGSSNEPAGVYEPSGQTAAKHQPNAAELRRMADEVLRQTESLREMVLRLFSRQAERNGIANGTAPFLREDEMIDIDPATRLWAQQEIAEGGYFSVENTGDRIFDFAVAIAGNDLEKLEQMQAAVEEGFRLAEQAFGGRLPQISQDTMEYVRNRFNERFEELRNPQAPDPVE